jgi:hypothetical protein
VVDAFYEFQKAVKSNADAMTTARQRLAADPAFVAEKLRKAATGESTDNLDAADEMAFQLLINQRTAEAGNDAAKLAEVYSMRMAYRLERGEIARRLQIGYDRNMTPAERALAAISDAIFTPTKRVEKYAKNLTGNKREECSTPLKSRGQPRPKLLAHPTADFKIDAHIPTHPPSAPMFPTRRTLYDVPTPKNPPPPLPTTTRIANESTVAKLRVFNSLPQSATMPRIRQPQSDSDHDHLLTAIQNPSARDIMYGVTFEALEVEILVPGDLPTTPALPQ